MLERLAPRPMQLTQARRDALEKFTCGEPCSPFSLAIRRDVVRSLWEAGWIVSTEPIPRFKAEVAFVITERGRDALRRQR